MSEETLLEFPCDFPIKIMGKASSHFIALARELVEKHTGPLADEAIATSFSRNGKFTSVTATIKAESQEQLDNIYRELTSNDEVLMAL